MKFNYSCFISYYRGKHPLVKHLVDDLHDVLKNELDLWIRKPVFIDEELHVGDILDNRLAVALCESACMIVIFTPSYFDEEETYCAREYYAMEKIERQRLEALTEAAERNHGLIIPIVFRGANKLTPALKKRLYFNFEDYTLLSKTPSDHPEYKPKIREIAEYIYDRSKAFKALDHHPCGDCANAELPSAVEVAQWLKGMIGGQVTQPPPWLVGNA